MDMRKRIILSSLLAIVWTMSGWAQSAQLVDSHDPDIPSFIDWEANVIYRASNAPLLHFFKSLDTLIMRGDRKVNILQIGDSHIQGGFFSNEVRVQFQKMMFLGNGGRGLIFPYKIAHTNGPWNYGIAYRGSWETTNNVKSHPEYPLGVTGYTAVTADTNARITVFANHKGNNPHYTISRVKVLHETGEASLEPYLPNAKAIEVIKDSFYTEFVLMEETDTVTIGFRKEFPHQRAFTLFGISIENEDPGVVYNSFGVNGAEVPSYLKCEYLVPHVRLLKPDLIIISLGTNDAYTRSFHPSEFMSQYEQLLDKLLEAAPNASILLTTPGDGYRYRRYYNSNNVGARDAIFKLAKEQDLAVWDFFSVMGGPNSVYKWYKSGLATYDKLHLTTSGYRLQGKLLFEAIMRAYYDYLDNPSGK